MKKKNLLLLVPITLSAALYFGYRAWDNVQTDKTPPEISISEESIQVSVSAPTSTLLRGITAQDDRDGDVTDSILVERITMLDSNGSIEVSIAAFDRSGNVAKATRTARYTDYQGPRFYLNQSLTFAADSRFDLLAAIGATDPLDGDIQHRVKATSMDSDAVDAAGNHEIEFRVTNSLGETVRLTLPVTVYSAEAYGLHVELSDYLVYLNRGSIFNVDSYLLEVRRGQNAVSLTDGMPAGYSYMTTGEVNTNIPGVYPVDYTVTYAQPTNDGTQYISGIARLIVVVEG